MNALNDKIADLGDSRVVESAVAILAKEFGVDDPSEASERVAKAVGDIDPAVLDAAARRAVKEDSETVVELMRLVLMDVAGDAAKSAEVERQVERSGEKAPFVVDDFLILGTICLAGYIAYQTKGVSSRTSETVYEEMPDGRLKITRRETTTYVNPFSAVGMLLKSLPGIGHHSSS